MSKVVEADYSIPHCKVTDNSDGGFTVRFIKPPVVYFLIALPILGLIAFIIACVAAILYGFIAFFVVLAALFYLLYFVSDYVGVPTTITVNPEFVTVNGKSMPRRDFGTFMNYGTEEKSGLGTAKGTFHTLGYTFGNRSFSCGGKWIKEREIVEFVSSLNLKLRGTPVAGAAPLPEQIREKRDIKF